MTVNEMHSAIGVKVYFIAGELKFLCTILDVKTGYGNPRFLIEPLAGTGRRWVEFSSIAPVTSEQLSQPRVVSNAYYPRLTTQSSNAMIKS